MWMSTNNPSNYSMHCHSVLFQIAYGLTELSPVCCQTQIDDPVELRVSTVGKMHSSTEVG